MFSIPNHGFTHPYFHRNISGKRQLFILSRETYVWRESATNSTHFLIKQLNAVEETMQFVEVKKVLAVLMNGLKLW
jgi:hypothetical protein